MKTSEVIGMTATDTIVDRILAINPAGGPVHTFSMDCERHGCTVIEVVS